MIQRRVVLLLLSALLAIPAVTGPAQGFPLEAETLEAVPGIEAGVWRTYAHPDAATGATMTPEEMATLAPVSIDITVTSFDTPDNAAAYFDEIADAPVEFETDSSQSIVSQDQANSTNDSQSLYRQRLGRGDDRTQGFEQVMLQQDEIVFTLMYTWQAEYQDGVEAPDNVSVPDAIEPLAEQIAASARSSAPVTFAADGSSTGGLWSYMPANGDPLLLSLIATRDISVFPPESDAAMPELTPVDELAGIESAVIRSFTPIDERAEIADLGTMAVGVYRFASPDDAVAAYDSLLANVTSEFTFQSGFEGNSLVTGDLAGVGERANLVRVDSVFPQGYQSQEYILTLREHYVFTVMTITGGPSTTGGTPVAISLSSAAAINLAISLVESGQPSPDATVFAEDATSTGGDWAFMPAAGDPLLHGLYPTLDQQLYPVNSAGQ